MDARTHSWIAIRAIALLEDNGDALKLVKLLKPNAYAAAAGAWIPDQTDAKKGDAGSKTENHVLKIEPCKDAAQRKRFTMKKDELMKRMGLYRLTAQYLQSDKTLDAAWWGKPYEGNVPKPGQHLPNRIMALSTMLKDLLLMGDQEVNKLTAQGPEFARFLLPEVRTHEEAVSMYFFMMSHFVADVSMPCHCDARKLANYGAGLHKQLEAHWSDWVGPEFDKDCLNKQTIDVDQLLAQARAVDANFNLKFAPGHIPSLQPNQDEWLEAMFLCRASFAIASIIAPCTTYPYDNQVPRAPFKVVFGNGNAQLLKDLDRVLIHDAILNTAIFWQHLWSDVSAN